MKAVELIAKLEKLVAENDEDLDVLIMDSESGWFDTIVDMKVVQPTKYNALMGPGVELVQGMF